VPAPLFLPWQKPLDSLFLPEASNLTENLPLFYPSQPVSRKFTAFLPGGNRFTEDLHN
jgi:hypothetical protein